MNTDNPAWAPSDHVLEAFNKSRTQSCSDLGFFSHRKPRYSEVSAQARHAENFTSDRQGCQQPKPHSDYCTGRDRFARGEEKDRESLHNNSLLSAALECLMSGFSGPVSAPI